ncbi:hypothetical protein P3X46_014851 [Hevea brasiliensis]|uniref:Trichome birefringence-like N-terminal domain-containing protein n=1 Tax=Hevea brasiliensis TaxID=3981 RepID=A0ABQ9LXA5_HEVBR|nr:protein trichome birefringence-like 25 [Hevea brasiliensis]KAJ9171490.1 hypothetical protein P3X46_014851 [Hevea brasiliensis]
MRSDSNPFSFTKHNHVLVKFAVSLLLIGLAFRLLVSDSIRFSSVGETPAIEQTTKTESPEANAVPLEDEEPGSLDFALNDSQTPFSNDSTANRTQISETGECDLFTGDWIPDPSGPFYTDRSCLAIEGHQNCMKNGRPDSGYLYWRWNPLGCDLPRFNPKKFLDLMRNKSWAFIGDSISRNHVQSLLCILSQVEHADEVYHDEEYRSKIWHFPAHNFTLSVIWTPFLIKANIFEDINGVSSSEIQLYLDVLDNKWTDQYRNFDYAVIAGGKWFLKTAIYHENDTVKGCHHCTGKNLTELGFDYAYRKALRLIFDFIARSDHRAFIFFRTTTPDHFENGEWSSGGTCNRTVPFKEGEIDMRDVDTTMRNIELEEFEKAAGLESEKGVILKLLDTTQLSLLRPDGHPGLYRQFQPFAKDKTAQVQNDCLHWCLPGPIDSWNDLVMEILVNNRQHR